MHFYIQNDLKYKAITEHFDKTEITKPYMMMPKAHFAIFNYSSFILHKINLHKHQYLIIIKRNTYWPIVCLQHKF